MMHEMSLLQRAIAKWGEDAQMKMVLEEMSELQKEICKLWRGKDNRDAIAEEVADVEIMLDQLELMLDIQYQVEQYRQKKLRRLQKRLED
jgi:pyruvate/2-oxoacid:ferredoxin oxidoreductase beta subunit